MIDGPVMLTATGRYVNPLHPEGWEPDVGEIAHALAHINRFTGHTYRPYSVAEHSCRVADLLPDSHQLAGLLHDAAEAYLGDMATPLKRHPVYGAAYRQAENNLMARIEEVFGVDCTDELIHWADRRLLCTERRDLMPQTDDEWLILRGVRPLDEPIVPWTADEAQAAFMARYRLLTLEVAA